MFFSGVGISGFPFFFFFLLFSGAFLALPLPQHPSTPAPQHHSPFPPNPPSTFPSPSLPRHPAHKHDFPLPLSFPGAFLALFHLDIQHQHQVSPFNPPVFSLSGAFLELRYLDIRTQHKLAPPLPPTTTSSSTSRRSPRPLSTRLNRPSTSISLTWILWHKDGKKWH